MPISFQTTQFGTIQAPGRFAPQFAVFEPTWLHAGLASTTADLAPFHLTGDSPGLSVPDDLTAGPILRLTQGTSANNKGTIQMNGEAIRLRAGKAHRFTARVRNNDVDQQKWFVGFAITDTDIIGGCTDLIGFRQNETTGRIDCISGKNATGTWGAESAGITQTNTTTVLTDAQWVDLCLEVDGLTARFYIDGVLVATHAGASIPDDESLTFSVEARTLEAAANTLDIQSLSVAAEL